MTRRRDFLAFTAGAVAARTVLPAVASAEVPADHPDAQLLAWCAAVIAMEAQHRQRAGEVDAPRQPDYYPTLDAITDTPAKTDAGNRAKLAVAVSFYDPDPPEGSIVDNLMWDAVCALASPPRVAPSVAPAPLHPDADLVAVCEHHRANHARYNADSGDLDPDDDPLWAAYMATHDAILASKPDTIEGIDALDPVLDDMRAQLIKVQVDKP